MKSVSVAYKAHLAQDLTTLCNMWRVTRTDGQVFTFTDAADDVVYNGQTYLASSGFTASNITTTDQLNVDNLEINSMLTSTTITDADLLAGKWDYALVEIFRVNYKDLTMGQEWMRKGRLGNVTTKRVAFVAELRGMTQPLQQNIGRVFAPSCDADLGDSRCTVNIAALTVTGSVTSTIDQQTFLDTARTETNSTVAKSITNITQGTTATVTAPAHGLSSGTQITITGVNGMTQINGYTVAITYVDANNFTIPINTTSGAGFGAYTSGGTATVSVPSEYFQGGKITWTSGLNNGLSMEVSQYHPSNIYLVLPMPYAIAVGDTYSMTPGCDKLNTTCNSRFSNIINFRGFPQVPGTDRMLSGS